MSVVNLAVSYITFITPDLPLKKRGALLKNLAAFFVLFVVFYIYLAGIIVVQNLKREVLADSLAKTSSENSKIETDFIKQGSVINVEYFLIQGYEKPKNLNIIRRAENFAAQNVEKQKLY